MDLTLLSAFLTTIATLASLLFVIYSFLRINRKIDRFEGLANTLSDLFRYEEDEEGNPLLDARLSKMMQTFGSSITQSLKMSALGSLSGISRLDKGLKGAMAADIVENKMPLIGLAGDIFGINTQRYIKNHPDAMMQLISDPRVQGFLGSIMGKNHPGGSPSTGQGVM